MSGRHYINTTTGQEYWILNGVAKLIGGPSYIPRKGTALACLETVKSFKSEGKQ